MKIGIAGFGYLGLALAFMFDMSGAIVLSIRLGQMKLYGLNEGQRYIQHFSFDEGQAQGGTEWF